MRKVGKPVFFIVAALVLCFTVLSFTGIYTTYGDITTAHIKGASDIRWGIDIRGGMDVTFSPADATVQVSESDVIKAQDIIKTRLMNQNITDYELYPDLDRGRVILRFPWRADEADFNPERAIAELGETALLTFREGQEVDENGLPTGVTAGEPILTGSAVESAVARMGQTESGTVEHFVELNFSEEGRTAFSEATGRLVGEQISIWMDDEMLSAPRVREQISTGQAMISSDPSAPFTAADVSDLAQRINGGALPFKMVSSDYSVITPSLGEDSRSAMLLAGIIAFAVVALYMIWQYRLPGIVAVIGLAGQVGLIVASTSGFLPFIPSFTLTLPGIAGIILAIGFGVDANVITAERIKEEVRVGKTLDGAIVAGYNRAFTAIFDGNITVIIVALILMGAFGPPTALMARILRPVFFMFGPATAGAIYSFGYTLLMGVISNFVMGIWACRLMQRSICRLKPLRKAWLFGGERPGREAKQRQAIPFMSHSKRFFQISLGLIALIIVASFVMQVQLDVQFKGGSIVSYSYTGELEAEAFAAEAQRLTGEPATAQRSRDATGTSSMVLNLPGDSGLSAEAAGALNEGLRAAFSQNNIAVLSSSNVSPAMGGEFLAKSLTAVAFASLLMVIYIALRFRRIGGWSAGVMGVVALLHDIVIVYGAFVLFRIPLNGNFIAVILTILGYSLNDTIVIYDRIRENKRLLGDRQSLGELVELSLNQCLTRTLNTTVTTVISMVVVTAVAIAFNVQSIISFSLPMILGLLSGVYSSVCVAGPLWVRWQNHKESN